jgi:hypothetical protein
VFDFEETGFSRGSDRIKTNSALGRGTSELVCGLQRGAVVLALIRRARRRLFCNELLSQGAIAVSAALASLILLLLLGTQVLDWRWLLPVPLAAAGAGLYRAYRRVPASYAVAQIVDRRLALADSLSTALYFSRGESSPGISPEVRRCQFERANRLSQAVDVRDAVPYAVPRAVYPMATLVLVASSLFALRYGLTSRLDLRPPLARILQQTLLAGRLSEDVRNLPRKIPRQVERQRESRALPADRDRQGGGEAEQPRDNPAAMSRAEAPHKSIADGSRNGDRKQSRDGQSGSGEQEAQAENRQSEPNGDPAGAGQQGERNSDGERQAGERQDPNGPGRSSTLLSRMKDAMQNLLSRMKPQSGSAGARQQAAMNRNGAQANAPEGGASQQQAGSESPAQPGQSGNSQSGQTGPEGRNSPDGQGKGGGKGDSGQAAKQPGNGIGSQDGAKDVKEAEQLAAMGKISEIIGKRAANVTGQATVEVQSSSQQLLHTPYEQRRASHSAGGAEISRDEVPVALQSYVEQYFEKVRKQKR